MTYYFLTQLKNRFGFTVFFAQPSLFTFYSSASGEVYSTSWDWLVENIKALRFFELTAVWTLTHSLFSISLIVSFCGRSSQRSRYRLIYHPCYRTYDKLNCFDHSFFPPDIITFEEAGTLKQPLCQYYCHGERSSPDRRCLSFPWKQRIYSFINTTKIIS